VTKRPQLDDLIEGDIPADERERLLRVHELLLRAGPPAELSPETEAGPTLAMTLQRAPRRARHRVALLAAALALVAAAFLAGYVSGNHDGNGVAAGRTLSLVGTKAAPDAFASLRIEPADAAGNWPMKIAVTGLPKLPDHGYYMVYLMRNGKPYAPCGTFVVAGKARGASVWLNAPYEVHRGDTWIVTKQFRGDRTLGPVVLQPRV
jgi:hypothetical protein